MENEDSLKPRIDRVANLINSLSSSSRQLSMSALDLQALGLSKKHQIEAAIDRVDDLGKVIDHLIDFLSELVCCYLRDNGVHCCDDCKD